MTHEPKRYPLTWLKKDRDLWERMLAEMPLHKAAPDMLAALREIMRNAATYQRGQIASVASAAIAKATK